MNQLLRMAMPLALLAFLSSNAQAASGAARCYHDDAPGEMDVGYCAAVRTGNTLYLSGSVGKGEMPVAIRTAYDALGATLAAHGLNFSHVVKETVYATDLDAFIQNKAVRKQYYGSTFPAATWVQVPRLYFPSYRVEVELIAVFPERNP
jgi:2-iminobutanoate/2-iminopropanoate deaminase